MCKVHDREPTNEEGRPYVQLKCDEELWHADGNVARTLSHRNGANISVAINSPSELGDSLRQMA